MKISRTAVAVTAALPAGMLLTLITEGVLGMNPGEVRAAGGIVLFIALCSGAWHGTHAAIARHEHTVQARSHRRAPKTRLHLVLPPPEALLWPIGSAPAEPEQDDAAIEETAAEQPAPARAAFEEYPGRAEILAAKRAAAADPYLQPADDVSPDEWPTQTIAAFDPQTGLYARQDTIQVPADATVVDGWDKTQLDVETYLRGNTYVRQPSTPATP